MRDVVPASCSSFYKAYPQNFAKTHIIDSELMMRSRIPIACAVQSFSEYFLIAKQIQCFSQLDLHFCAMSSERIASLSTAGVRLARGGLCARGTPHAGRRRRAGTRRPGERCAATGRAYLACACGNAARTRQGHPLPGRALPNSGKYTSGPIHV